MGCAFHSDIDKNRHCSLANVKNWAFVMSEHLCGFYRVPIIPGLHVPSNADIETDEAVMHESSKLHFRGLNKILFRSSILC